MSRSKIILAVTLTIASFAHAQPSGLDAYSDDVVLSELAKRDMAAVLEYAFEVEKTPEPERAALRARMSLNQLKRTDLSPAQRQQLVQTVVAGLSDESIRASDDPQSLYEQADLLIADGIAADINTLEYWGPSPTTRRRVLPIVEKVIVMADRAVETSAAQMEGVVIRGPDDTAGVEQFTRLENLNLAAQQLRQQLNYYHALALDPADPRRAAAALAAIEYLMPLDVPENPARNFVRVMLGKLHSARLSTDAFAGARTAFGAVIADDGIAPPEVEPAEYLAADLGNQFEARYFLAVNEVLARKPDDAEKQYRAMLTWQQRAGVDEATRQQWSVANQILDYRIQGLRGELGDTAARERASSLLLALIEKRPDLQELILGQLLQNVDPGAPVASLDVLLLKALVSEAEEQVANFESQRPVDARELSRGLEAAREIVRRDPDPQLTESAAYRVAVFLEASEQKREAALAYLDFAERYGSANLDLATAALSRGQNLVGRLRADSPGDVEIDALLDRVFPISIGAPFNQTQYTYAYAARLQRQKKYAEAVATYRKVPESDPQHGDAQYFMLRALDSLHLQSPASDAGRDARVAEMTRLADEVRERLLRAAGDDPATRNQRRSRLAYTTLLGSRLAGAERDEPQKALDLLKDFDSEVKGLPDEADLMGDAMFMRVNAYMALDRVDEAVNTLLKLIEATGGQRGGAIVRTMLERLEAEFESARQAGDQGRMATLQKNRAALTPRLVEWASRQRGPEAEKQLYIYRRFNAETQRLAADFIADEAEARARREQALELFVGLDSDVAAYRNTLPQAEAVRARYDTAVALSIARLYYDLGNMEEARKRFSRLAVDRALGLPVVVRVESGIETESDNDAYWEAIYKWVRATQATDQPTDAFKSYLKEQYVRWGDRVGGSSWKKEFEALRAELISEFDPNALP